MLEHDVLTKGGKLFYANTKVLGIIGRNIGYTYSPFIHNNSIKQLNRNEVYLKFDLRQGQLESFLNIMWHIGAIGFNITSPYKEIIANLVSSGGRGAINTIYRGKTGWLGTSTDGIGFFRALQHLSVKIDDFSDVIFLGDGGVVKSILQEQIDRHVNSPVTYHIVRRNSLNDEKFSEEKSVLIIKFYEFSVKNLLNLLSSKQSQHVLLIQATNAPLHGNSLAELIPAIKNFKGTFVDLVYGETSALYTYAKERGLCSQDGIPMLLEQAKASQEFWWQQSLSYKNLKKIFHSQ